MTPATRSLVGRHRSPPLAVGCSLLLVLLCACWRPATTSTSPTTPATTESAPVAQQEKKDTNLKDNAETAVNRVSNYTVNSDSLDLSGRNIGSLGLLALRTRRVQSLNMSANQLERLADDAFAEMPSLRCLDLAANRIGAIGARAFAGLAGLQHLNVSRNRLTRLADATFAGLGSLQQLDLSLNDLAEIAPGALELSSLTRLLLAGNRRLGGNAKAPLFVATGRRLRTMDATRTSLRTVPSALTHSIRTLRLAENRIGAIGRGDMDPYPLLQLLDLCANGLAEIEEDALGRLEMLAVLYLTGNRLRAMPRSLPERLRVLRAERNRIATLRPSDLAGLAHLEVLLLSGNRLRRIADGAFVAVPNLVALDLSENPLEALPAGALTGPRQLRVLRLRRLNVSLAAAPSAEAAFPLPETAYLITLDLGGSATMARQWLADRAALAAARELQELDLSDCAIETLPRDTLHYLPQLRALQLRDNALNCSGLEWLAEWMRLRGAAGERPDVRCQSPGDLWDTPLVDLQSLQEPTPITTTTTTTTQVVVWSEAVDSIPTTAKAAPEREPLSLVEDARRPRRRPGMYLLVVGVAGAALILVTLSSRASRRPRDDLQILRARPHDGELIEVASLPSVAELW